MLTKRQYQELEAEVARLKELRDAHLASGNDAKAADLNELHTRKNRLLEIERDARRPDPNFKGRAF